MQMEDKYFLCVIEEMDRLWFHQVILFSQPVEKEKPVPVPYVSESQSCPSSMFPLFPLPFDETSTDESPSPEKQASSESISDAPQDDSIKTNKEEKNEGLARVNVLCNRTRSHSSSPSSQSQYSHRKLRKTCAAKRKILQKSMSCKTLGELELDEVKGFMDLGFIFKKETLSPRMMSVVPGLQRLALHRNKQQMNATEAEKDTDADEEKKRDIMRPYLSEAWLIKRPDSPLLSLKLPKACSGSNMKKHLRFWAKTVASEIHQE